MPTRFLYGEAILAAVREANELGIKRKFGVAYWGAGAWERLGLGEDLSGTKVICDLWSEACDPEAIIELLENGAEVRHVEGFHAKTYLYPDRVVLGSANASRAGLGSPNEVAPTRMETALLCTDAAVLKEARAWFDIAWKKGMLIDVAAVEAYRPMAVASPDRPSLLHAIANEPGLLTGLDLVLTVYRERETSKEAVVTWKTVKGEYGKDDMQSYDREGITPFYEVSPKDAAASPPERIYLDFTRTGKKLSYNGIWKVRSGDPKPVAGAGTILIMLDRLPSLRGYKVRDAEMTAFATALAKRVDEDDLVMPNDAVTLAAREALRP